MNKSSSSLFQIMAKQLTLFGSSVSQIEPYFKTPKTEYEQYVNKQWELNHHKYGQKQEFLQKVLKD